MDRDLQDLFKQKVIEELENNFNPELFDTAVIFDTIAPRLDDKLLGKFIEGIPDLSRNEDRDPFSFPDNYRLDQVINIFYKLELPFEKLEKYIDYNISSKKEYYNWLLHLDTFDYSKFNPYWLIGKNLKYYVKAFKKSKPLLNYLKKYLKNNHDSEIAKFYFENLT